MIEHALALAAAVRTQCPPNPAVGCVIVDARGQLLGQGATQRTGGPHAEVMALRHAAAQGHSVVGACAYVTLEPCAHQGRTGPCCEALIAAGIAKVVASLPDPNPLVAGKGFARLRAAGVEVEVGPGADAARRLNLGFFSRMLRHSPWVRSKIAASLDGQTALRNGVSQWITSQEARADGQHWRARAGAVLTGIGTVLSDNPLLDVRLPDTQRQPHLVIVDSQLRTPVASRLFSVPRTVLIYCAQPDASRMAALQAQGAEVIACPDPRGAGVDLSGLLRDLARREVNEVHVEAGPQLNAALLQAGLVDEYLLYLAPKFLGNARQMLPFGPLERLEDTFQLAFTSVDRIGPDLRVQAAIPGRDDF